MRGLLTALSLIGLIGQAAAFDAQTLGTLGTLADPKTCERCHPDHYREWSGSMHAYAAKDPVFRAMNMLGQDATQGRLGSFCVGCHAPLAVRGGLTRDGLNLDEVPEKLHGVTCYFCHSADAIEGDHNNALHLAADGKFRAGIADPADNPVHGSLHSPLHDRKRAESAAFCGACHDIVTPRGLALERTYREWRRSLYAKPAEEGGLTCPACHMPGRNGQAAQIAGAPIRRIHSHRWPGVDVALEDFPDKPAQRAAVEQALKTAVGSQVCVTQGKRGIELRVSLENVAAGHAFPSGAAQDRRLWVEISAWREGRKVFASGETKPDAGFADPKDSRLWLFRDSLKDVHGNETHRFWDAAALSGELLPVPTAASGKGSGRRPAHATRIYRYADRRLPDEARLSVRLRPIGRDVLDELVRLGYLASEDAAQMPVFDLAGQTWRASDRQRCVGMSARPVRVGKP